MTWLRDIPMSDPGWREISLSAKGNFANVRLSPVAELTNNIVTKIFNVSVAGKIKGIVNPDKAYDDGVYTWYPAVLEGIPPEIYVWIAMEAFEYELGAFINVDEPLFYDLALPGQPTLRITERERDVLVMALHALGDYLASVPGKP